MVPDVLSSHPQLDWFCNITPQPMRKARRSYKKWNTKQKKNPKYIFLCESLDGSSKFMTQSPRKITARSKISRAIWQFKCFLQVPPWTADLVTFAPHIFQGPHFQTRTGTKQTLSWHHLRITTTVLQLHEPPGPNPGAVDPFHNVHE